MMLSSDDFRSVVSNAPMVSLDIILIDSTQRILVGKRKNKPAKGYWFVPGGRIFKGESLDSAFNRISQDELNLNLTLACSSLIGVFDHFYEDSFFGDDITTHYVAIGRKVLLSKQEYELPSSQHSEYRWLTKEEILSEDTVHINTKRYFEN